MDCDVTPLVNVHLNASSLVVGIIRIRHVESWVRVETVDHFPDIDNGISLPPMLKTVKLKIME